MHINSTYTLNPTKLVVFKRREQLWFRNGGIGPGRQKFHGRIAAAKGGGIPPKRRWMDGGETRRCAETVAVQCQGERDRQSRETWSRGTTGVNGWKTKKNYKNED